MKQPQQRKRCSWACACWTAWTCRVASERVGIDLLARYERELAELTAEGLLVWENDGRLRLAEDAYLVANQVFTRFLV